MDTLLQMLFELIGGLGIFLLGMKNMSDGMQAVAGSSLRRLIGAVTSNRIAATIVGVIVTCVVQSSSITTVMVVGFVNSNVMSLTQAIGVIMGANIGTTITGWILVLKIGKYGLPLLGASSFFFLFSKNERWRYGAMAIMGVGMIFFGLELMKDACSIIKQMPDFEAWFHTFQADSYIGVMKCAMIGCLLTTLVQSSSATLGITISLASQGVISYETAAALVLGENIGTTITALLASLGATTNARRAAYFHVIFNLIGVLWITAIFNWYVDFVPRFIDVDVNIAETVPIMQATETGAEVKIGEEVSYPNTTAAIAATHSIFNITNTILFLPFVTLFARFLTWIVPGKDFKEAPQLTDLDIRMLETPLLAIEQSQKEIEQMGRGCNKMIDWLSELRDQDQLDQVLLDRVKNRERILDRMQDEITEFVTNLLSGNVPHSVAVEARRQIRMADEFESISDELEDLVKFDRKLRQKNERFSNEQRDRLRNLNDFTRKYLFEIYEGLIKGNDSILSDTESVSRRFNSEIKALRRQHLNELSDGSISPAVSVAYLASLNAYSKVRDHAYNVAETISGEK